MEAVGHVCGALMRHGDAMCGVRVACRGVCPKKSRCLGIFSRVLASIGSFACVHGPFPTPLSPL
eukprot:4719299-Prymnesium_polylepis.1